MNAKWAFSRRKYREKKFRLFRFSKKKKIKKKKWKLTYLHTNLSLKEPCQQPFDLLVLITLYTNTFFLLALVVLSFSIGLCYTVLRFSHSIFRKDNLSRIVGKKKT